MIDTSACEEYFKEVCETANGTGMIKLFQEKVDYLSTYSCTEKEPDKTRCKLFKDFSPLSFVFHMEQKNQAGDYEYWFHGGLIFSGPRDDDDADFGWSVCT